MRIFTILILLIIPFFNAIAQCDYNTIGTFDGTAYSDWPLLTTASSITYGSFSQESTIIHNGTNALKAEVITEHAWAVRTFHSCENPLKKTIIILLHYG